MAIPQPNATDKLNSPDHSLMHRQIASDTSAAAESLIVDANGTVIGALSGPKSVTDVTTNQTPATSDAGKMYHFTYSTAADRTFTLPSVGSSDDALPFWVQNSSEHLVTVQPSDSDSVWRSGAGYGVELTTDSLCCFRYNHAATRWDIIHKSGGQVRLEGLRVHIPFNSVVGDTSSTWNRAFDKLGRHYPAGPISWNTGRLSGQDVEYNGSNRYTLMSGSSDFDVFKATDIHATIAGWFYRDANGTSEALFSYYEDGNNYYDMELRADNALGVNYFSGGTGYVNTTGGSISATTWTHFALVIDNGKTGGYLNGSQVLWDAAFTADTFSAVFNIGRFGDGSLYFDGRLSDFFIAFNNPYDAEPNSTPNDTLSNWDKPFVGVQ